MTSPTFDNIHHLSSHHWPYWLKLTLNFYSNIFAGNFLYIDDQPILNDSDVECQIYWWGSVTNLAYAQVERNTAVNVCLWHTNQCWTSGPTIHVHTHTSLNLHTIGSQYGFRNRWWLVLKSLKLNILARVTDDGQHQHRQTIASMATASIHHHSLRHLTRYVTT